MGTAAMKWSGIPLKIAVQWANTLYLAIPEFVRTLTLENLMPYYFKDLNTDG